MPKTVGHTKPFLTFSYLLLPVLTIIQIERFMHIQNLKTNLTRNCISLHSRCTRELILLLDRFKVCLNSSANKDKPAIS